MECGRALWWFLKAINEGHMQNDFDIHCCWLSPMSFNWNIELNNGACSLMPATLKMSCGQAFLGHFQHVLLFTFFKNCWYNYFWVKYCILRIIRHTLSKFLFLTFLSILLLFAHLSHSFSSSVVARQLRFKTDRNFNSNTGHFYINTEYKTHLNFGGYFQIKKCIL